jgi:hypothetical protein
MIKFLKRKKSRPTNKGKCISCRFNVDNNWCIVGSKYPNRDCINGELWEEYKK